MLISLIRQAFEKSGIPKKLSNALMWRLTRNKRGISKRLLNLAERYISHYNDFSYDFEQNGEKHVLEVLARHDITVVFDVGANVGDWSRLASTFFTNATIHSFELS